LTSQNGAAEYLQSIAQEFNDPKAFAREEQFTLFRLAKVGPEFASEDWMDRRQINYDSQAFRDAFPNGFPVLHIGLQGVDVRFVGGGIVDNTRDVYIPLYNDSGERMGQRKGRRSHMHIFQEAFTACFKVPPLSPEAQKVVGTVALWGQHLGAMDDPDQPGQQREWAWDVPREAKAPDFQYDGPVREIILRSGDGDSTAATAGTAVTVQLSEDESNAAAQAALIGLDASDVQGHTAAILNVKGLTDDWYEAAQAKAAGALAHERKLILAENGKIVALTEAPAPAGIG